MKHRNIGLLLAWVAATIPNLAFAQSSSPTFLEENRLAIAIVVCTYLAPSIIAFYRKHRSIGSIIAINILLGWTAIGWIWAFIWSLGSTKTDVVIVNPSPVATTPQTSSASLPVANTTVAERIAELKAMLDAGTINPAEFEMLKAEAMKALA
jgi:hypothetical protein